MIMCPRITREFDVFCRDWTANFPIFVREPLTARIVNNQDQSTYLKTATCTR